LGVVEVGVDGEGVLEDDLGEAVEGVEGGGARWTVLDDLEAAEGLEVGVGVDVVEGDELVVFDGEEAVMADGGVVL